MRVTEMLFALALWFSFLAWDGVVMAAGPVPGTQPSLPKNAKPLFGVGPNGYFENAEEMNKLRNANPAVFAKVRHMADEKKAAVDSAKEGGGAKAGDGNQSLSRELLRAIDPKLQEETLKACHLSSGAVHRSLSAARAAGPVISGKGIPKEIRFTR